MFKPIIDYGGSLVMSREALKRVHRMDLFSNHSSLSLLLLVLNQCRTIPTTFKILIFVLFFRIHSMGENFERVKL